MPRSPQPPRGSTPGTSPGPPDSGPFHYFTPGPYFGHLTARPEPGPTLPELCLPSTLAATVSGDQPLCSPASRMQARGRKGTGALAQVSSWLPGSDLSNKPRASPILPPPSLPFAQPHSQDLRAHAPPGSAPGEVPANALPRTPDPAAESDGPRRCEERGPGRVRGEGYEDAEQKVPSAPSFAGPPVGHR